MESVAKILSEISKGQSQEKIEELLNTSEDVKSENETECSICGGLGFVVPDVPPAHPKFGRAVSCSCKQLEHDSSKSERLMKMSGLGGLQMCTFSGFQPTGLGLTTLVEDSLTYALGCALKFAEEPEGWLLFQGGYGCGKTHLAAAIANFRIGLGHPTLFINVADLLDHLRATFNPSSNITYDKQFELIRTIPLLILDDLGTQSNTDWSKEKLFQIFNHRYSNQLPTVITTNLELEEIEPRIRSRLVDRNLVTHAKILAPDFRRPFDDRDQSDLSSLSLHEDQIFQTFYTDKSNSRGNRENLLLALNAAKQFAEAPEGWIVFYSRNIYSNGKTHLAAAIANHIVSKGGSALFIDTVELLDHLRATFNPSSGIRYDKRFDEIKKAPLLILDDLGAQSATPWAKEKIHQLLNYRYTAQLPTVITTSLDIETELDPKLASRLLDGKICTPFWIKVDSYKHR